MRRDIVISESSSRRDVVAIKGKVSVRKRDGIRQCCGRVKGWRDSRDVAYGVAQFSSFQSRYVYDVKKQGDR